MIRIITDSTAHFVDPDFPRKNNITVVPLTINFGKKSFKEGIDISPEDFFRRIAESGEMPTSVAPAVGEFSKIYSQQLKEGDEIISIHVSSKLSQTLSNAQTASTPYMGRNKLHLIDSLTTSTGLGLLVEMAASAAAAGSSVDDVVRLVRGHSHQLYTAFFVDTLDYLANANRFSKAHAILGALLNFKPFLSIEEGDIVPTEKMQSRMQAAERLVEFATEFATSELKHMAILHSELKPTDEMKFLLEQLALSFPNRNFPVLLCHPSLGTYVGPNAIGVVVCEGQSYED